MPWQNFWFSLTAEPRHQRLQDFGFEAFFVSDSCWCWALVTKTCTNLQGTNDNATRRWRCRLAGLSSAYAALTASTLRSLMCNSRNCFSSTGLGACVSKH